MFHRTPEPLVASITDTTKWEAVALDCEMGIDKSGESQLIRLTLVDFFTGEPLIDSLVKRSAPMAHYNTRYSGVNAADMRRAEKSGSCIRGRDKARKRIWSYVGPGTVVVMHTGGNDLAALRWIHGAVVDILLLERYAIPVEGGRLLKNLLSRRLGREIQKGKKGHCSFEDAMAC
jgi:RNA exonuclease 1